ncbi:glutathione S-transferase N-terminal domain-containing protein [Aquicella lusitana]|uniref:RNA polymerase-associated protein n=1 Tax=Aquicella lusitana TaxID=254246 RepID=A0A370GM06_9COXI|nr:glutathione S-transferase N-terminal domain-containing protein [Aquicella lusitana]RDI44755.1 RNA polymerase-associated protein [Aquicella lusitana]VVC72952.1 Stringent starvation protein A [Aquicella lusitana]
MAIITNKRSVMTLYSGAVDILSHRVRIVLAEKGVSYEVINIESRGKTEDLLELNPYGNVPTLVDRELALYEPNIIAEYLDERFPHPPLMPVYPVARAKARLIIYRFDREWGPLIRKLETGKINDSRAAAKELTSYLLQLVPAFNASPYFLGEEFTLVDCCIAPVLWRLPAWGITLPPAETKVVNKYADRLFQRDSFQASLTEAEQELRKSAKAETA